MNDDPSMIPGAAGAAPRFRIGDYVRIARPDYWVKNVFVLPGSATAVVLTNATFIDALAPTLIALLSVCVIASANYVINEWFDSEFDRHHPVKKTGRQRRDRCAALTWQSNTCC